MFPLDTGNPPGCATEIRRRRRGGIADFSHVAAYRDGTSIVGVGVWLAGRGLQAVLFQVPAFHAATIGTTAAVLAAIALAACLVPLRRAARLSRWRR